MAKLEAEKDGLDEDAAPSVNVTVNNSGDGTDSPDSDSNSDQQQVPVQQNTSVGVTMFGTRRVPLAEKEKWFKTYWRPAAAWVYLFINIFDFVAAPVMSMLLPKFVSGTAYAPWSSLTLSNGGLFHLAFGAIIGVTAWGKTRERVAGLDV